MNAGIVIDALMVRDTTTGTALEYSSSSGLYLFAVLSKSSPTDILTGWSSSDSYEYDVDALFAQLAQGIGLNTTECKDEDIEMMPTEETKKYEPRCTFDTSTSAGYYGEVDTPYYEYHSERDGILLYSSNATDMGLMQNGQLIVDDSVDFEIESDSVDIEVESEEVTEESPNRLCSVCGHPECTTL